MGTEALVMSAILWFVLRHVWGVRSPKHAAALCVSVSTTGGVRVPQFLIVVAHGKEPPIYEGEAWYVVYLGTKYKY